MTSNNMNIRADYGEMPDGPYEKEDELLAALSAWAGDPTTDGGAFSILERGERTQAQTLYRGAYRRIRCSRSGKPRSHNGATPNTSSNKCDCPWEIYIELCADGWRTTVPGIRARDRVLEMRASSLHEIHNHPLLDTPAPKITRHKRRRRESYDGPEATVTATGAKGKLRSAEEIYADRLEIMKGGERLNYRKKMKKDENPAPTKDSGKTRRLAISHHYSAVLGSPSPDQWKGQNGTIRKICAALAISKNSSISVENVLKTILQCKERGVEYMGERAQLADKLGRKRILELDTEEASIITRCYKEGISVKKTRVVVNEYRQSIDAPELSIAVIYSTLQRLKEAAGLPVAPSYLVKSGQQGKQPIQPTLINARTNLQHERSSLQPAAAGPAQDAAATTYDADSGRQKVSAQNETNFQTGTTEDQSQVATDPSNTAGATGSDAATIPQPAAKATPASLNGSRQQSREHDQQLRKDAGSWRALMETLRHGGFPCDSVEEIAEAVLAGKQQKPSAETGQTKENQSMQTNDTSVPRAKRQRVAQHDTLLCMETLDDASDEATAAAQTPATAATLETNEFDV